MGQATHQFRSESQAGLPTAGHVDTPHGVCGAQRIISSLLPGGSVMLEKMPSSVWEVGNEKESGHYPGIHIFHHGPASSRLLLTQRSGLTQPPFRESPLLSCSSRPQCSVVSCTPTPTVSHKTPLPKTTWVEACTKLSADILCLLSLTTANKQTKSET